MSDLQIWETAWRNIQSDYQSGKISFHQFQKERDYMFAALRQIKLALHSRSPNQASEEE